MKQNTILDMTLRSKFFLGLALFTLLPLGALAQQRIAVVNLRTVFDGYYKTKAADATLKERTGEFKKEKTAMVEQYQKLTENYKKAMEDANNQAISADEREKRKKAAEDSLLEVKQMEQALQEFDRRAFATLEEQEQRMREKLLKEIQEVIDLKAKAGNFTLIVNTASETRNSNPAVLFSSGQDDLTDSVLKDLNAKAPPGYLESTPEKNSKL